jgi:uncharacterized protein (TIGR02300 family)
MKLEWGKKVCCPSCSSPFYDLRKTALLCPNCGNSFSISEVRTRRHRSIAIDDVGVDDEKIDVMSGFDGCESEDEADIIEDVCQVDVLGEIKKIDDIDL